MGTTRDFVGRRGRLGVCIWGIGDEGIRLGKMCFGVGALAGGDDVVIDSAIGGGISVTSDDRSRSMARLFANLANAGRLLLITFASLVGC